MMCLRATCKSPPRLLSHPCLSHCKPLDVKLHRSYKNGERGQTYNYTRVFPETTSQTEYFEATAGPMVRTQQPLAMQSYQGCAYFATAKSGSTIHADLKSFALQRRRSWSC